MQSPVLTVLALILSSYTCRGAGVDKLSILVDLEVDPDGCAEPLGGEMVGDIACNSLQNMLEFVAGITDAANGSYVEVRIAAGHYEVTDSVVIEQNVVILAESPGTVLVSFDDLALENEAMGEYHAILIQNAAFAEIEGIAFESSRGIITFENVSRVTVSNSSFRYFVNGALDMYMCFQVSVSDCIFEHNGPVNITAKSDQYRGSAAGVSIGYDDNHYNNITGTPPESVPDGGGSVSITGCTFRYNEQRPLPEDELDVNEFLATYKYSGRGGALCLAINSSFAFDASIDNCTVENNFAQALGGGFYIAFSGYHEHLSTVNNSRFFQGHARDVGGGGLFVGFVEAGRTRSYSVRLEVFNSDFSWNKAVFGGGIFFQAGPQITSDGELTNHIYMENSSFNTNIAKEYGAAVCTSALLFFVPTFYLIPIIIKDSNFDGNYALGRGGVVSTAYVPISLVGEVNFRQNIGRSLVVIGTRVEVYGDVSFIGNGITESTGRVIDAGAIYLTSFAQIVLHAGAKMDFINNTGVLGAGLVVDYHIQSNISKTYLQTIYNPLCPIRSENATMRPDEWNNVNIKFDGNKALAGSAVYVNGIHTCAWTGNGQVDLERSFRWDFIDFGINVNTIHGSGRENRNWYVQTPAEKINIKENVTAFLGEKYNIYAVGLDELDQFTAAVLQLSDAPLSRVPGDVNITFIPGTGVPSKLEDLSIFSRSLSNSDRYEIFEKPRRTLITSLLTTNVIQEYFYITLEECPAGYKLKYMEDTERFGCECNSERDTRIASCNGRSILLTSALWGASVKAVNETSHSLVTYPCPFHYCSCVENGSSCMFMFDESKPNSQCHCLRNGVLCGSCEEGYGFTVLLNRCDTCSAWNVLWALGLVFGAAFFIGLFFALKWAPLDWFYPVLYYVQIVPMMTFFFPHSFDIVQPYALYVSSALSFYYCYDFCIYPGLYAEISYLMKFLPFLITILLCFIIAVFRRYYRLHRQSWHGLWWVILLQYSHVVHTAMTILGCPQLPDSDSVVKARWIVNGNVQCFQNLHLLAALVAIVILLFCISIIPVIFIYSLGYVEKPLTIYKTMSELTMSFKPDCPWWPAAELLRRFILILLIVAFPGNNYPTIFYLAITVTITTFIQPFKHAISNILEILLTVDALLLLLVRNTSAISSDEGRDFNATLMDDRQCTSQNLTDKKTVTHEAYAVTPFYYIPTAVFILTIIALMIHIIWALIKKKQLSRANDDIEALSYAYETNNNPTTTYLASFSGHHKLKRKTKIKSRFHNPRYLHFGWTRRPAAEVEQRRQRYIMRRKKGQSLLEKNTPDNIPLHPIPAEQNAKSTSEGDRQESDKSCPSNSTTKSKSGHRTNDSSTLPQQRTTPKRTPLGKSSITVKPSWRFVPTKKHKSSEDTSDTAQNLL